MIRLSMGTAIELGLINKRQDIAPTTAYIMIGEKCTNKCDFCSQSIESSTRKDKLSRVVWPEFTKEIILDALKKYNGTNIKRICIQSMSSKEAHESVLEFLSYITNKIEIPISLSAKLESKQDVDKFFSMGIDKIAIAVDAANKEIYERIKGGNFEQKVFFITDMVNTYPGKISTHIIVGLGETHRDIYDLYEYLNKQGITISLFAFTPIRGTKMEHINQPDIDSYRKVQLMTYMIDNGYKLESFQFENNYLKAILIDDKIKKDILRGYPFEIKGCKNCNRPYYNERPGNTIYNYSRHLNSEEINQSLKEIGIENNL